MARKSRASALPLVPWLPLPANSQLSVVDPGPDVLLTKAADRDITEWLAGWMALTRLEAAGAPPPGPLLLHGPPGTGKTAVTKMIARRLEVTRRVVVLDAMRVMSQFMGESGARIAAAVDVAATVGAVLVIEEVDTLASSRQFGSGAELESTRVTTAVMRVIERRMPIIMTSNRADVLDPAVLRRCEYIVPMPMPTPDQRRAIVERELGTALGDLALETVDAAGAVKPIPLAIVLPLARRARRTSLLDHIDPVAALAALIADRTT